MIQRIRSALSFGLSAEDEDRFRAAKLREDASQARTIIKLILPFLLIFTINDYSFFGFSGLFLALTSGRILLVIYTFWLLGKLDSVTTYTSYDRVEFAWALIFAVFSLTINATRPQAFVTHAIIVVLAVFVTTLSITNRFTNQLIVSLIWTAGESLIIAPSLTASPTTVSILISMLLANLIAVVCGWLLNGWRRREYLALVAEGRAEEKLAKVNEELMATNEQLSRSEEELAALNEELRTSQEELQRYSTSLETQVEDRTREIVNVKERLEAFMDSSTEGFSLYDESLNLVDANNVVIKRFSAGTRREDVIGRNITELYPGIEKTRWYNAYRKVLETGEPYHIDAQPGVASHAGLLLSASAFKVGSGLGVVSRDDTDRIGLEERLHEAQRGEDIDRVSAMVAHDIRNPLNTAAQALELATKRGGDISLISLSAKSIDRAIKMIEELRENTRLIKPHPVPIDIRLLVEDTIREFPPHTGVTTECIFNGELDAINVDPALMRRVLENLLGNAAEAMSGGGRISVKAWRSKGETLISVEDTGTGIPEEVARKIFTPLYTTKAKGVGLGLSFCRRTVEAHGGSIWFESEPGKGTTFTVKLPQLNQ